MGVQVLMHCVTVKFLNSKVLKQVDRSAAYWPRNAKLGT